MIKIKKYSNGSYSFENSKGRDINIPSELAEQIIELKKFAYRTPFGSYSDRIQVTNHKPEKLPGSNWYKANQH